MLIVLWYLDKELSNINKNLVSLKKENLNKEEKDNLKYYNFKKSQFERAIKILERF